MRQAWLPVIILGSAGCFAAHGEDLGDAGVDTDTRPVCDDDDEDGYGAGVGCLGADCDDGDQARHADCPECDPGMTEICYRGPDGTSGVGLCRSGERACLEAGWGDCVGDILPAAEGCDGVDQDCNGVVDDGFGTCGDCDPTCRMVCAGADCAVPLSDGAWVERVPGGSVHVMEGAPDLSRHVLWIGEQGRAAVHQIDTQTYDVVGVYRVATDRAMDLHVTAVDPRGNAFVCAQMKRETTLSRVDASDCVDRDDSGSIETSSGSDDLLPEGEDECVRWTTPIDTGVVVSGAFGPDGRLWMGWIYPRGHLHEQSIAEYDPATGELLQVLPVTPVPYSVVGDADGLWIGGALGGLSHVGVDGTGEIVHFAPDDPQSFRSIAVREQGLVIGMPVSTYDTSARSLTRVDDEDDTNSVTIDSLGQTWALRSRVEDNGEIRRWDPDFGDLERFPLELPAREVIADLESQIWTVWDNVAVYDATTAIHLATLFDPDECEFPCLPANGFTGDATGARLHATMPHLIEHGEVRATFDASCTPNERSTPRMLTLDAEAGLDLVLETRNALPDRLSNAPWQPLADGDHVPGDHVVPVQQWAGPFSVEVRVRLRGDQGGTLNRIALRWHCN